MRSVLPLASASVVSFGIANSTASDVGVMSCSSSQRWSGVIRRIGGGAVNGTPANVLSCLLLLIWVYVDKNTFANTGFLVVRKSARYYATFEEIRRGMAPVIDTFIFCTTLKTMLYVKLYIFFIFFLQSQWFRTILVVYSLIHGEYLHKVAPLYYSTLLIELAQIKKRPPQDYPATTA